MSSGSVSAEAIVRAQIAAVNAGEVDGIVPDLAEGVILGDGAPTCSVAGKPVREIMRGATTALAAHLELKRFDRDE